MKYMHTKILAAVSVAIALFNTSTASAVTTLRITEANPTGSSEAYNFDWFEVTNTGSSAVDITGWSVDDSSSITTPARGAINGITSIAAGESVILIESSTANLAANKTAFANAWFAGNLPVNLQIGSYSASGVSLSASGDGVGLFDNAGTPVLQAYISFLATTTTGGTVDNAAGINDTTGASSNVTARSIVGTNGGFLSSGNQIGSPGSIANASVSPVPVPAAAWLMVSGLGALGAMARRRRQA
jgi:hypothetical protein